ncbi:hypothetical protein F4692_002183 [Nocardioides cavernae]|uniref:Uncharacterized protein n=1 Tax=Nocardioides cavernae TaxID=1921566 RepID=A0A7Y9H378_9ACTN|nr:hypothetical protein [Nocardioides cavernae]NYE37050.1 hypothetical protein [Nocardioides cavernae]
MPPAKIAAALALLGGALWIVRAVLGGGDDPVAGTLHVIGLGCLLIGSAVFGTTLVRSDAVGMRLLIGVASGLLTLSLISAFRPADAVWYDGFWGGVAVLVGGITLLRARGSAGNAATGAHAR